MQPILNFIANFVDKYIVHIPEEQKEEFKKDAAVIGEGVKEAAPLIIEAAAKGAVEGAVKS